MEPLIRQTDHVPTHEASAFEAACKYRDLGWSTIPMRGKRPIVNWSEYAKRLPNVEELKDWFLETKDANIGVVTGRVSGIIVVDLDDGEAIKHWAEHDRKTNLVTMTGGGGMHLFYRCPCEVVRNRVKALSKSIDVRAENGVVLVEPSVHPHTGQRYRFAQPIDNVELGSLPMFDPSWVSKPVGREQQHAQRRPGTHGKIQDIHAYVRSIRAISGQGGHNAAFRVANLFVHEAGMTEAQATEAMTVWNLECAEPPFSPAQIAHKISDAMRVGKP